MPEKKLKFQEFLDSEPSFNSESLIDIEDIIVPKSQIRQYFDKDKLEQLAESIGQHGVLEPLLIDKEKKLIAGERRLRASIMVGLSQIPVKILDVSPEQAKTLAIIENLQREDLNPVEETEGILELLQLKLEQNRQEVIALLYKMNKADDNVIIPQAEVVENTFNSLGKFKWESFVINRLRLLNLPTSILEAIRQGKIEYTKGTAIARVKEEEFRNKLLEEAVSYNLSLGDIKDKIARHKNPSPQTNSYENLSDEELIKDFRQTYQKFSRSKKVWSNRKNRKKIETLLIQLKNLVED